MLKFSRKNGNGRTNQYDRLRSDDEELDIFDQKEVSLGLGDDFGQKVRLSQAGGFMRNILEPRNYSTDE